MRISAAIKSILYGVSTDDRRLRNKAYLEDQVNMQTVDGSGLHKRPPAELISTGTMTNYVNDATYDTIIKSFLIGDETFYLTVKNVTADPYAAKTVQFYDVDGTAMATPTPLAAYLAGVATKDDIEIETQEDTVFIVNKTLNTALTSLTRGTDTYSLIHVKEAPLEGAVLSVTYKDNAGVTFTSEITVLAGEADSRGTDVIASLLRDAINADLNTGISAQSAGSIVALTRDDGAYADVTVTDQNNNRTLVAINGELTDVNDLPRYIPGDITLTIRPEKSSDRGVFYMVAEGDVTYTPPAPPPADTTITAGVGTNAQGIVYSGVRSIVIEGQTVGTFGSNTPALTLQGATFRNIEITNNGTTSTLSMYGYWDTQNEGWTPGTVVKVTLIDKTNGNVIIDRAINFVWTNCGWLPSCTPSKDYIYSIQGLPPTTLVSGREYELWINESFLLNEGMKAVSWRETSHPDEPYEFNASTMPWVVTKASASSINAQATVWDEKRAGDNETNKAPSFIGKPIKSLSIFQNRLLAVTGEDISTTETDNNRSWWRNTATQLLATHPVQVRSTSPDSDTFHNVLNHNRDLLLFSKKSQFKLAGDYPLTPQTTGLPQTGSYISNPEVPPASIGRNVYFSFNYGNYGGISKYQTGSEKERQDRADPITDHVKKLMTGTAQQIIGDANLGIIYAIHDTAIYVCDYDPLPSHDGNKRYAWSKWIELSGTTETTIADATLLGNKLQLVIVDGSTRADIIQLDVIQDPNATDKRVYLDYLTELSCNATGEITLPTGYPTDATLTVVYGSNTDQVGNVATYTRVGDTITVTSDFADGWNFSVGLPFLSYVIPSTLYIRDEGGYVNPFTRLNIVKYLAHLTDSADVSAELLSDYYNLPDQYWSGLIANNIYTQTDRVSDNTGTFDIGAGMQSDLHFIKIYSNGHLPMNITGIDYLGTYSSRGRRF